ncbi:MAG: peptide chain release factor N(5)-glutamine methyltransferase [Parachlamydiales bacterium]|nr:peptide chain release factor N(5)-glutamine methyltransferase [Parachlamydiales bacterium]
MTTVRQNIQFFRHYLEQRDILDPLSSSKELLASLIGCSYGEIDLYMDDELSPDRQKAFEKMMLRRGEGEPVPYILGEISFLGARLSLSRDTLIPRPETEILTDRIIQMLQKEKTSNKVLWDIGCGCGCIGLAIKKHCPALHVVLSDISPKALEIAKKNARLNQMDCSFLEGDLFAPFQGTKADYIVSNPPYIPKEEYLRLHREVKDFEPQIALLGGEEGTEYYQRFSQEFLSYVNRPAKIFFEIGYNQGGAVQKIFRHSGKVDHDWKGLDRFFFLEIE